MVSEGAGIPKPDLGFLEDRRRAWLGAARALVAEAADQGHRIHINGSVLRPAYAPYGFHERSDVDLAVEVARLPSRTYGDILEWVDAERIATGIPFHPYPLEGVPRPFDPEAPFGVNGAPSAVNGGSPGRLSPARLTTKGGHF
ncbi:hypothetical protein [Thiohalorhabdus methylotrophus]|uniref:Nucleotidyltransferase domain-containing protein n=1 Tax=Thiohalorhabdus methylotrophus TaxID=3242694 RepID=A0ABV4TZQ6_9GAMM